MCYFGFAEFLILAFFFGLPLAIVFAAIIHSRNKRH